VVTAHQKLAVVIVLLALGGALWAGLSAYQSWNTGRLRQFGWITSGFIALQVASGVALAIGGNRPADSLHFIVGPLVIVSLPIANVVAWRRETHGERGQGIALVIAWLITLVLALRAVGTGGLG